VMLAAIHSTFLLNIFIQIQSGLAVNFV
jgi:hypothetical protein